MTGALVLSMGIGWVALGWRYWPRVESFSPDPSIALDVPFQPVFGPPSKSNSQLADLTLPIQTLADKSSLSPRGDARDYVSLSIYWWPNPLTRLPYLPRDGHMNPEADRYDAPKLHNMIAIVSRLSAEGKSEHDQRACEWLRAWFVTPETRMNPHLTFAQMMPGVAAGGRQGIIEGLPISTTLLDAIAVLDQRSAFTSAERRALRQWFGEYLAWLQSSRPGRAEAVRLNNHGTWYDVQIAALATSLGLDELACRTVEGSRSRIGIQFAPDGSQPHELTRSKSFDYSLYNLDGWHHLEQLARRHHCVSVWTCKGKTDVSPADGLSYLQRHFDSWSHPQIHAPSRAALDQFSRRVAETRL